MYLLYCSDCRGLPWRRKMLAKQPCVQSLTLSKPGSTRLLAVVSQYKVEMIQPLGETWCLPMQFADQQSPALKLLISQVASATWRSIFPVWICCVPTSTRPVGAFLDTHAHFLFRPRFAGLFPNSHLRGMKPWSFRGTDTAGGWPCQVRRCR